MAGRGQPNDRLHTARLRAPLRVGIQHLRVAPVWSDLFGNFRHGCLHDLPDCGAQCATALKRCAKPTSGQLISNAFASGVSRPLRVCALAGVTRMPAFRSAARVQRGSAQQQSSPVSRKAVCAPVCASVNATSVVAASAVPARECRPAGCVTRVLACPGFGALTS